MANRNITPEEYERLARSLDHCGFVQNSYEQFIRTGSVEKIWSYMARVGFATAFWSALAYWAAGWVGVQIWISAVFLFTFIVRDFNYRGHSSLVGTGKHGAPVNQVIYGIIAGEWHENHHKYPRLARSGLVWWQVDLPYWIILFMKGCGIVTKYNAVPVAEAPAASPAA
jgi:fatty-acid desaturase